MSIRSFNQENRARKDAVAPETESSLGVVLLRVAWLAILLGLAMEVLLFLGAGFGDVFGLESLTADLVKKVSWSALVCSGLAVGASLSKIRLPMMGILGFFAAPLAFEVSRGLYKGTLEALAAGGVRLVVGTLFGGAILSLDYASTPDAFLGAGLVSRALNEILFPVGCSLGLFSAGVAGEKMVREDPGCIHGW